MISLDTLRADCLSGLKDTGCRELFIGIESGSPRILKRIHKTHDLEKIMVVIERLLSANINIKGYFIFGFDGENREDMQMTHNLAKKLKEVSQKYTANFRVSVFQYRPYHGTEMYDDMITKGVDIGLTRENSELSEIIGRSQFNFMSGNFSNVSDEDLLDFIKMTNALND